MKNVRMDRRVKKKEKKGLTPLVERRKKKGSMPFHNLKDAIELSGGYLQ